MNFFRKKAGIIVIAMMAVFLGTMVASGLLKKERTAPQAPVQAVEEPQFKNEGQLWFVSDKGDTITDILIETADTESETSMGLMYRKSMAPGQGMLFTFPDEDYRGFWMKNTYIPLDIIYASADGTIVSTQNYTTPYSEETLPSEGKAKYVVEVNAGFWEKHKLQKGYKIIFNRQD